MRKDDFVTGQFNWFTGVVESRMDPLEQNRVQVRCLGYHTDNLGEIPTEDLPWATVMMPTTESGTSGIGTSPHGLMQGSWVVGFFRDGPMAQDPIIIGSVASMSKEMPDPSKGFADPNLEYPRPEYINDSDVNKLAREDSYSESDPLQQRQGTDAVNQVKTASPAKISTVAEDKSDSYYAEGTWDELKPMNGDHVPQYPYNKVYESEQGHVIEIDDTPGHERLNRQHTSGTYEEILKDRTRQVKVVSKDYEIVISDKNVHVQGNCNLTVDGDLRTMVYGNYHLEVEKDLTWNVKGSVQRKIGGNLETEISRNRATNVGMDDSLGVMMNQFGNVVKDKQITIGNDYIINTNNNYSNTIINDSNEYSGGKMTKAGLGALMITSDGNIGVETTKDMIEKVDGAHTITVVGQQTFEAENLDIKNNVDLTGTLDASVEVKAGDPEVTLTGHVHPQGADGGGDAQVNTGSGTG